jgi:hypothetical protein
MNQQGPAARAIASIGAQVTILVFFFNKKRTLRKCFFKPSRHFAGLSSI